MPLLSYANRIKLFNLHLIHILNLFFKQVCFWVTSTDILYALLNRQRYKPKLNIHSFINESFGNKLAAHPDCLRGPGRINRLRVTPLPLCNASLFITINFWRSSSMIKRNSDRRRYVMTKSACT